jgi:hypothetical protein
MYVVVVDSTDMSRYSTTCLVQTANSYQSLVRLCCFPINQVCYLRQKLLTA